MIKPGELSDSIERYVPIDYALSTVITAVFVLSYDSPFWVRLVPLPLFVYNGLRWRAGDHKHYFVDLHEYRKEFPRMEFQYQWKSAYYLVLFAISLIMAVFALIEYFDLD